MARLRSREGDAAATEAQVQPVVLPHLHGLGGRAAGGDLPGMLIGAEPGDPVLDWMLPAPAPVTAGLFMDVIVVEVMTGDAVLTGAPVPVGFAGRFAAAEIDADTAAVASATSSDRVVGRK